MTLALDNLLISLAISAAIFVLLYWPAWLICRRVGLPGPIALLMFVPGIHLVAMWAFALLRWPIERRPATRA